MNFVGFYAADRASATVEATGDSDATIYINWGTSATSGSRWTIVGTLDAATGQVNYINGSKVDYEFAEGSDTPEETVIYSEGTGTITFTNGTMIWEDDKEGNTITFTYSA